LSMIVSARIDYQRRCTDSTANAEPVSSRN
jgi:hypothetical protein